VGRGGSVRNSARPAHQSTINKLKEGSSETSEGGERVRGGGELGRGGGAAGAGVRVGLLRRAWRRRERRRDKAASS